MESVLRNPAAKGYIHTDLPSIVFNIQFWNNLTTLISVVKPIADAITNLEGDTCISNVFRVQHYTVFSKFKIWRSLEDFYSPQNPTTITEDIKIFVRAKLNARWNLIQDPIHTVSYLFDPRFRTDLNGENFWRNGLASIKKVHRYISTNIES